ncbi:MAG: SIR2 family protein [Pedobacter sp.]
MANTQSIDWSKTNILKIQNEVFTENCYLWLCDSANDDDQTKKERKYLREKIEPWLTALFQSEHLSLLTGAGLIIGVNGIAKLQAGSMTKPDGITILFTEIEKKAIESAEKTKRGDPNCEDYFRIAFDFVTGLNAIGDSRSSELKSELYNEFSKFINNVIDSEQFLIKALTDKSSTEQTANEALLYLKSLLLSFSSRAASRERLNIFTTNYDRFIEYALDDAGILWLDRFAGKLKPIFRNIRLELDYHYNPPGIRGEPRYVEGVVRLVKLHGSIDWERNENREIVRKPWPFGEAPQTKSDKSEETNLLEKVIVYPNASKDMETALYPYAELFRDFATAICRPNSVVVTFGYGFGDDHINRILKDMLTIPSTHLCIISYDKASGRIEEFLKDINRAQYTLLIGCHFGDLRTLVDNYLPKPAIDRITTRLADIRDSRKKSKESAPDTDNSGDNNA